MQETTTQDALKKWKKEVCGFSNLKITQLIEKIRWIQMKEVTKENWKMECQYQEELNEWLLRDEIIWKLKSR